MLRVLEVIHGYPPRYNAGSEIYTQMVSCELSRRGHKVTVFSRIEDPYLKDFELVSEKDNLDSSIEVYLANHARGRDRYKNEGMDKAFKRVLDVANPDIVHINHLNHLSTGIIDVASSEKIPVVFTMHDFWLACPRGQFLRMSLGEAEIYPECGKQENKQCAIHCMSRMWGGVNTAEDIAYWTRWVDLRMREISRLTKEVSAFISPSQHLKNRLIKELKIPPKKVIYESYGFNLKRLSGRKREREEDFVFGFIGRIDYSKGIDLLIKAFGMTSGKAKLRIWGRPSTQESSSLMRLADSLPPNRRTQIEWLPKYENVNIVERVFNRVDAIVVPSIWDENSPLVIQEALQAKIPVITSEKGGMGELVHDGVNGFTFKHRSVEDLAEKLQLVLDNPESASRIAQRGFLGANDGSIHSIEDHVSTLLQIFLSAKEGKSYA
jgi:glycosyltransferase involved in cell wall biosynthesis